MDDFAFRKGSSYGTIICDLCTNQPIALLTGRDTATVTDYLKQQSKLYVVARDGSNSYKAAITAVSSTIVQVSDRFHLVQNLSKTLKDVLTRLSTHIELHQETAEVIEPANNSVSLTSKEEEKWLLIQDIQKAHKEGTSQRQLAKTYQLSRNTVKSYVEKEQPIQYHRETKISTLIQPFYELVKERFNSGIPITAILKELQQQGFTGSYSTVRKTIKRLRPSNDTIKVETKKISRGKIIYCFWRFYERLTERQQVNLQAVLLAYPTTQPIYAFVQSVRHAFSDIDLETILQIIHRFQSEETKEIKRHLNMVQDDLDAIKAAFLYTFNTSIVE